MRIDGTDEAIMAVLQQDGRLSNREVARRLEISEGQVRQRLRKLLNGGAVRFDAVTDGRAMGIDFIAFVKVSVVPKHLEAFLRTCAEFEDVWYLAALSGRFNVLAGLCTENAIDAMHIVNRRYAAPRRGQRDRSAAGVRRDQARLPRDRRAPGIALSGTPAPRAPAGAPAIRSSSGGSATRSWRIRRRWLVVSERRSNVRFTDTESTDGSFA